MPCDSLLSMFKKAEILQFIKKCSTEATSFIFCSCKKIYNNYLRATIVLSNNAGLGISKCSIMPCDKGSETQPCKKYRHVKYMDVFNMTSKHVKIHCKEVAMKYFKSEIEFSRIVRIGVVLKEHSHEVMILRTYH